MQTFSDLILAFGGGTKFAQAIDISVQLAHVMKTRNNVNSVYWDRIIEAAPKYEVAGVDSALLVKLAAQRPVKSRDPATHRRAERIT